MSYFVYQLINQKTGAVYVGFTSRTLEQRKAEHMGLARGRAHINAMVKNISNRPIAEAMRAHPNPDDWVIEALWQTPVYPEAREMEKAFINQMNAHYVCLNTDIPKTAGSLSNAVAHSVITGQAVACFPWDWRGHEDYPGVIVYKGFNDKTWKYGYRGRGESDHTGMWKEFTTDDTTFDDAHFTAAKYFEDWKNDEYSAERFQQEFLCDFTPDDEAPEFRYDSRITPIKTDGEFDYMVRDKDGKILCRIVSSNDSPLPNGESIWIETDHNVEMIHIH